MNNKGYMLYELIIAFVLTMIISIFLLDTAFKLNDKNNELTISSKINVIQEDFTNRFYNDADKSESFYLVGEVDTEDYSHCSFLKNGTDIVYFGINKKSNSLYYGDYETELPEGVTVSNIYCSSTYADETGYENSIFHPIRKGNENTGIIVNVELNDEYLDKNYDINILYLYEDENVNYNMS